MVVYVDLVTSYDRLFQGKGVGYTAAEDKVCYLYFSRIHAFVYAACYRQESLLGNDTCRAMA